MPMDTMPVSSKAGMQLRALQNERRVGENGSCIMGVRSGFPVGRYGLRWRLQLYKDHRDCVSDRRRWNGWPDEAELKL